MNYAIIALIILFLSLLWHPLSLIVFTLFMSAWLFFYFLRESPLVVFGYEVGDKAVLLLLTVFTVVFLLLTDVTVNIVVALFVAVAVIVAHAAVRRTDDLPVSDVGFEDESGARVVYSRNTGGLGERLPLKDTASSSFSASN
ncbi:hypothetical protein BVRB_008070 [Beta vulgaris subsp. vulgaris]|uniref:PRA1 family protein n=2 Tax=Beta vulgaris subsp. vulgaris TaxID=3555 RepID=A0A0J8DX62_BETVV|nr:hypothetical protein BVRB_008070 [Beta vulgaris subsp. vulgaris]